MDFHLASMRDNEQEPSDAQLVGMVLAQLQMFTTNRWSSRAAFIHQRTAALIHPFGVDERDL